MCGDFDEDESNIFPSRPYNFSCDFDGDEPGLFSHRSQIDINNLLIYYAMKSYVEPEVKKCTYQPKSLDIATDESAKIVELKDIAQCKLLFIDKDIFNQMICHYCWRVCVNNTKRGFSNFYYEIGKQPLNLNTNHNLIKSVEFTFISFSSPPIQNSHMHLFYAPLQPKSLLDIATDESAKL